MYPKKSGGFGEKRRSGFGGGERRSSFGGGRREFGGGRPNFGGGRQSYGVGRPSFGRDRNDGPKELFRATCAKCGNSCEVPFRPTGEKPVYCGDCFGSQREDTHDRGGRRDNQRRDRAFVPKPFSNERFRTEKPAHDGARWEALERKVTILGEKMDRVLAFLGEKNRVVIDMPKKSKKSADEDAITSSLETLLSDAGKMLPKSKVAAKKKPSKKIKGSTQKVEKKPKKKTSKKK